MPTPAFPLPFTCPSGPLQSWSLPPAPSPSVPSRPMDGAERQPGSRQAAWGDTGVGVRGEVLLAGGRRGRAWGRGAAGGGTPAGKGCRPARVPVQGWAAGPEGGGGTGVALTSRRVPEQPGASSPAAAATAHPARPPPPETAAPRRLR